MSFEQEQLIKLERTLEYPYDNFIQKNSFKQESVHVHTILYCPPGHSFILYEYFMCS